MDGWGELFKSRKERGWGSRIDGAHGSIRFRLLGLLTLEKNFRASWG